MSNTNGTNSLARSINGIITYDDGAGTLIQNGKIITNTFITNTFNALNAVVGIIGSNAGSIKCNIIDALNDINSGSICSLFNNVVLGEIFIACLNTFKINIGNATSIINLGSFRFFGTSLNGVNPAANMSIADSQTTGNLVIANQFQRIGSISIGPSVIGDINIGAETIGDINIGTQTTGDINIGSSTSLTTIKNKIIVGQFQAIGYTACYANIYSVNGQCNLDFHSSAYYDVGYDSRIYAYGGTATSGNGSLVYTANIHNFLGDILVASLKAKTPGGTLSIGENLINNGGSGGILNIGTATSSPPINIITGGNITIGSATSTNTFIRNEDGLIIGQNPASYNPATGLMSAPGTRFTNKTGLALIDFHSNTLAGTNPDSRILATGGSTANEAGNLYIGSGVINITANTSSLSLNAGNGLIYLKGIDNCSLETVLGTGNCYLDFHSSSQYSDYDARIICNGAGTSGSAGTGQMSYTAANHYFNGGIRANTGLSYGKGNLTGVFFIQNGGSILNITVNAQTAMTSIYVAFTSSFTSSPIVNVSLYTGYASSMGMVLSVVNPTTDGFTLNGYNSRTVAAINNQWGYHYTATGNY